MTTKRGFGSIRRLPSGRYQARYTGPRGRTVTAPCTFAAKVHAEMWLTDTRRGIDTARVQAPAVTFAEYAPQWLASRQSAGRPLKARTRDHYQGILDRELLPAFGDCELSTINAAAVRAWYAGALADKPTMRAHSYSLLRTIMTTAVADELIEVNPCRIRGAGKSKRVHKIRPATIAEVEAITAKMPARLQLAVTCSSWLAMRLGEVLELRRGDIDLDAGVVRVRRGVVRVGGKLQADTPKSDAGMRDIHIPPHLIERFREHLFTHTRPGADALLFPSPAHPDRWHQAKELRLHFYAAREAAGRPDLRWHDLRHTGAVLAASTGATLAELMARLGHSTAEAAMRYQHAAADRDRAVAEAMSKLA
jgi:integrase